MNNEKKQLIKDLVFGLTLASEVLGSFIIAVIAGLYIDDYLNIKPVLTLIFLLIAFIHVIHILLKVGKKWTKKLL